MSGSQLPPDDGRISPRPMYDASAGLRTLADTIPEAIAKAEALGASDVAAHLRLALEATRRRAVEAGH